ncbi:flagellar hook-basal body complex protein FliE [Paenibacillus antri]|uniref:Flagellar hook-basal body complex protein FliE n=1 Tax=Paenibacillus antri TaxID=2582848 RepID=A0A5R9G0L6_9BACL|nr:flagellar hook-basal body complex protein FliE [Paenibacillus antri]TLS49852.1 flagellar hook-basal body complex protein FliE [Paenibacillus antri]
MEVSGVKPLAISGIASNGGTGAAKLGDVTKVTESFGNILENALQAVDNQEKQVKALNEQFVTGQISDVHTLMIASEKAQLGLQLTVQVRNKVIEAYQEIMRTQL